MSNEGMTYKDKQAYARTLGIKNVMLKTDELDVAIAEAESKANAAEQGAEDTPEGENEAGNLTPLGDEDYEQEETPEDKGEAPQSNIDQNTALSLYAAQMAKEALEKLNTMPAQGKKKSTPEEEIVRRHNSDREVIRTMEKVPITIPGGYPGAPKYITSTVNGHRIQIKTGATVMVPKAHAENIMRSWKQKQENMERFEADEKKAKQL